MDILSMQATYRSVRFHGVFDARGNKESAWFLVEAGRGSREGVKVRQQMTTAFPFTYRGVRRHQVLLHGASCTSLETHQSRAWNQDRNHRKIICLPVIILPMYRKEHDNTSKPSYSWLFQGKRPSRHTQGTKTETWVPSPEPELSWGTQEARTELWQELRQHRHSPQVTKGPGQPFCSWTPLAPAWCADTPPK